MPFRGSSDPDRSFSIFAVDPNSDSGDIIAEARLSQLPNRTSAEFGISVRDDWHGRGLATLLMDEIEAEARRRGLEKVVGYVLKDNENMHGMWPNGAMSVRRTKTTRISISLLWIT